MSSLTDSIPADLGPLLSAPDLSGWDVALAGLVVVIGWIASIFARKGMLALLRRLRGLSDEFANLIARLVKYFVVLLAVGIALSFLGASIQPLLAGAIVIAIVLVLALRGIANNFAAGVVIQTRRPIKLGDEIEIDGYVGTVSDLNGRSVYVVTRDGRTVHIPNEHVLQNTLVNLSEAGSRRSEVEVRTLLGEEPTTALPELLETAMHAVDGVHKREKTVVLTTSASSDRATYRIRYWHHPLHGPEISSRVVDAVGDALRKTGVGFTVQSVIPDPPLTPPDQV